MFMRIQGVWTLPSGRTSTIGILGMSCDEGGARVGEGVQHGLIKVLG